MYYRVERERGSRAWPWEVSYLFLEWFVAHRNESLTCRLHFKEETPSIQKNNKPGQALLIVFFVPIRLDDLSIYFFDNFVL